MATEDVVLQIKAEIADLKAKLAEAEAEFDATTGRMSQAGERLEDPLAQAVGNVAERIDTLSVVVQGLNSTVSSGAIESTDKYVIFRDALAGVLEEAQQIREEMKAAGMEGSESAEDLNRAIQDGTVVLAEYGDEFGAVRKVALDALDDIKSRNAETVVLFDENRDSAEGFRVALDQIQSDNIRDVQAGAQSLRDILGLLDQTSRQTFGSLSDVLTRAREDVFAFAEAADSGSTATNRFGRVAAVSINDVRREISSLRAEGADIDKEAVEALDRLDARFQQTVQRAGELKAAQRELSVEIDNAARGAGGFQRPLTNINDIILALNPNLLKLVSGLVLFEGATRIGQRVADQINDVLGSLTETVGKLSGRQEEAAQAHDKARLAIEAILNPTRLLANANEIAKSSLEELLAVEGDLANEQAELLALTNILTKQGIDVQGKSVEELRKQYNELVAAGKLRSQQVQQQAAEEEALAEQIAGSREELEKQAETLEGAFEILKERGQLTDAVLADLDKRIEAQIAAWERLGVAAPGALLSMQQEVRTLLPELDEATSSLEEMEEATRRIEQATDDFLDSVRGNREELSERTVAILDGVAALERMGEVNSAVAENIAEEVQELLALYEEFGIEAPAALEKLADRYPPVIEKTKELADESKRAGEELDTMLDVAESAETRLKKSEDAISKYLKTIEELGDQPVLTEEQIQQLNEAEREAFFARESTTEFAESQEELGQAVDDTQIAFQSQSTLLDDLMNVYGLTAENAQKLAKAAGGTADGLERIAEEGESSKDGMEAAAEGADKAAEAFNRAEGAARAFFDLVSTKGVQAREILISIKACLDQIAGVEL